MYFNWLFMSYYECILFHPECVLRTNTSRIRWSSHSADICVRQRPWAWATMIRILFSLHIMVYRMLTKMLECISLQAVYWSQISIVDKFILILIYSKSLSFSFLSFSQFKHWVLKLIFSVFQSSLQIIHYLKDYKHIFFLHD